MSASREQSLQNGLMKIDLIATLNDCDQFDFQITNIAVERQPRSERWQFGPMDCSQEARHCIDAVRINDCMANNRTNSIISAYTWAVQQIRTQNPSVQLIVSKVRTQNSDDSIALNTAIDSWATQHSRTRPVNRLWVTSSISAIDQMT